MKQSHAAFMIAAAMLVGCNDAQTPTTPLVSASSGPVAQTLRGTVMRDPENRVLPSLVLRLEDGTLIGLSGPEAMPLASVLGADVEVVGTVEGESIIEVQRFVVRMVDGSDVSDGVLELTDDGYSLRLTLGGLRSVIDPPAELAAHVGERMWLIESDGGIPTAFGVIRS